MDRYKPRITSMGSGSPIVGIVGGMHGNESGPAIIKKLQKNVSLKKGTLQFILANPPALAKKTRFIDVDLNRVFPGKPDGNIEERLAYELKVEGKKCDYLLDLHSCSMESEAFCIVRSTKGKQFHLAQMTGLQNIVHYPLKTQKGGSFIDYARCGIGLELGLHDKKETIEKGYDAVLRVLTSLDMIDRSIYRLSKQSVFKVTQQYYQDKNFIPRNDIRNFQLIKKGDVLGKTRKGLRRAREDFYPIMYRQKSYGRILCWVGKKIK